MESLSAVSNAAEYSNFFPSILALHLHTLFYTLFIILVDLFPLLPFDITKSETPLSGSAYIEELFDFVSAKDISLDEIITSKANEQIDQYKGIISILFPIIYAPHTTKLVVLLINKVDLLKSIYEYSAANNLDDPLPELGTLYSENVERYAETKYNRLKAYLLEEVFKDPARQPEIPESKLFVQCISAYEGTNIQDLLLKIRVQYAKPLKRN